MNNKKKSFTHQKIQLRNFTDQFSFQHFFPPLKIEKLNKNQKAFWINWEAWTFYTEYVFLSLNFLHYEVECIDNFF